MSSSMIPSGSNLEEISNSSCTTSLSSIDDNDQVDRLLESFVGKATQVIPATEQQTSEQSATNGHDELSEPIVKTKTVLKSLGKDYFEPLPVGWLKVIHYSGMPLYLHRESRVCTMSKPYYLGEGSVRKHDVPISAIPCLEYRREKSKASTTEEEAGSVVLETVEDHKREKWLKSDDVREYCEKLFEFDEVKVRKFKKWADRRKFNAIVREEKQRPSLPDDTKLITCSSSGSGGSSKKGFVMNPAGKSSVCILHEFVQHKEKVQPKYIYKELENPVLPYQATAQIQNVHYGVGYGKSKKDAKEEAARKTIQILIPEYKDKIETTTANKPGGDHSDEMKFFDNIQIDDERVYDLCTKAGLQSPYQILMEWKSRNAGIVSDTEIKQGLVELRQNKNVYRMKLDEHEVNVVCKNSRQGKQLASQALLKKLHPQIKSWSGILLMYGRGSRKTPKEKKEEEQKITELQATACPHQPNYAILAKLREEMLKLNY